MLNKSFWTVALKTQISICTFSRGNVGCKKMNNLFLHILTHHSLKPIDRCQRYGHFNVCRSSLRKWHLSLLTGFKSHHNNQYCICLYDRQFQICRLVVWLLLLWISALYSSVPLLDPIPIYWSHDQSHYQAADLNLAVIRSTHSVLAAAVGVNPVNRLRCHF